ncbi:NinX [Vibrio phage 1.197.A._10N.286.54.F2]|nr:NinX [Vibrio phage 1.197.A._10N.286.54.F2]
MSYEDMSDFEISKEVAFAIRGRDAVCVIDTSLGKLVRIFNGNPKNEDDSGWVDFDPCNNPSDAWPIIQFIWITLMSPPYRGYGTLWDNTVVRYNCGKLRAAMICFLKMKDAEK